MPPELSYLDVDGKHFEIELCDKALTLAPLTRDGFLITLIIDWQPYSFEFTKEQFAQAFPRCAYFDTVPESAIFNLSCDINMTRKRAEKVACFLTTSIGSKQISIKGVPKNVT